MSSVSDRIIAALAEAASQRVAAAAVLHLQRQRATLSGEDSGLETVWDEFCVQAQEMESFFWEAYTDAAEQFIETELDKLPRYELEAIWLQTNPGWDWLYDVDEANDGRAGRKVPYNAGEAARHVVNRYLIPLAEEFSNEAIERYLEYGQKARHELDELEQEFIQRR